MKKSPTYLSDSRPKFTPFEINCGKIPAYRYQGSLKSELKAKTITPVEAVAILEDMLVIRELEEMIVKLRSGAYEPIRDYQLPRPDARLGGPGRHRRRRVLRAAIARQHHQHPSRPRRKPREGHRRHPPDDRRTAPQARAELQVQPARRPRRGGAGRTRLSHHLRIVRQGRRLLPRPRRFDAHRRFHRRPSRRQRHRRRRRARSPRARPWPTAISSAAMSCAALPATARMPTASCWNR